MFVTNGKNKVALCGHCKEVILQKTGYRYYCGKLLHDACYHIFVQENRRFDSQLKLFTNL